jgi:alkylation response protein AidB-like acyl-CoA dehydrogenase
VVSGIAENTWLEKARGLAEEIERWRDYGEQERSLAPELFEAFKAAGFYGFALSRAFGGDQVRLGSVVEVIEEVSRHDGSAGWNLLIGSLSGAFADYLPEAAAFEIFADGSVSVGSFAPTGQAVAVDGGYRVSGKWAFTSGCQNADWLMGGFMLMDGGRPKSRPDGRPELRIMFLPKAQCEILDTWHTVGMRGTGSHDFRVEDVFVPADREFSFWDLGRGPAERQSRAYVQPFLPHIGGPVMAAVSLGIARDAIESFKDFALNKTPEAASSTLATQHTTHLRLGEAEALVRSSRAYLYDIVRQVESVTNQGLETTEVVGSAVRLACAYIAQSCTQAVDLMFDLAGGSSIYSSSRLEKCFRDVHVVSHHILISPSNIEMVGQYLLGQGLQMRR